MHSKHSYRPDIPPCQGLKVYFGVVLGCKGGGRRKNFSGPEKFFQTQASQTGSTGKTSQDKPTQAKGSLQGQMTVSS